MERHSGGIKLSLLILGLCIQFIGYIACVMAVEMFSPTLVIIGAIFSGRDFGSSVKYGLDNPVHVSDFQAGFLWMCLGIISGYAINRAGENLKTVFLVSLVSFVIVLALTKTNSASYFLWLPILFQPLLCVAGGYWRKKRVVV